MSKLDGVDILAECIEAVEDGRLTIAQCLTQYPQYGESLEALLPLAMTLRQAPEVAPSAAFQQDARQRLLKKLPPQTHGLPFWARLRQAVSSLHLVNKGTRLSWLVVIVLAVIFFASSGLAYAADGAVPGDTLYGMDRALEDFRLSWTLSPQTAVRLRLNYAQERLAEAEKLLARGDEHLAKIAMDHFDLMMAAVEAWQKHNNQVLDESDGERPLNGFTSVITTTTPTMTATITPTATDTPSATPSLTHTPTATSTPTVTATPTMTATATITPTSTTTFTPTTTAASTHTIVPTVTMASPHTLTPEARILICHMPPGNTANANTIEVGASAVQAHLDHGDTVGVCVDNTPLSATPMPTLDVTPTSTLISTNTPQPTNTALPTDPPQPTDTPLPTATEAPPAQVVICHRPPGNPDNPMTITVNENEVQAHLDHGDSLGPCP